MEKLIVRAYEDGGNPRLESDIVRTKDGFLLWPFSEDGDGCYKFHLNAEIINPNDEIIEAVVEVEWSDSEYAPYHYYYALHSQNDDLVYIPAKTEKSRQSAVVKIPPGSHCLCASPRYSTGRLESLVNSLDKNIFNIKTIGKSRMQRGIYGIEAGSPEKRPIAIITRIHPYESVGSFFIEGMLNWLGGSDGRDFLKDNRLVIIPMANPDGVALGYHKRTYGGINLSHDCLNTVEPEAVAIRGFFVVHKPYLIADFHGWMHLYDDNITTNSLERGKALYDKMIHYSKAIDIRYPEYPIEGEKNNIGGILLDQCGADFFNCSWISHGRSIKDLHEIGIAFLKSLASV